MADWDIEQVKSFCTDTVTDIESINQLILNLKIFKNYNHYEMSSEQLKPPQQSQSDSTPIELEDQNKNTEKQPRTNSQASASETKSHKSLGIRGVDNKSEKKKDSDAIKLTNTNTFNSSNFSPMLLADLDRNKRRPSSDIDDRRKEIPKIELLTSQLSECKNELIQQLALNEDYGKKVRKLEKQLALNETELKLQASLIAFKEEKLKQQHEEMIEIKVELDKEKAMNRTQLGLLEKYYPKVCSDLKRMMKEKESK